MADDYGDDFEADVELESQKKSGGLSLLRSAAAEVEKEEKNKHRQLKHYLIIH